MYVYQIYIIIINIIYYIQYTIEVISQFLSLFHDYTNS